LERELEGLLTASTYAPQMSHVLSDHIGRLQDGQAWTAGEYP